MNKGLLLIVLGLIISFLLVRVPSQVPDEPATSPAPTGTTAYVSLIKSITITIVGIGVFIFMVLCYLAFSTDHLFH